MTYTTIFEKIICIFQLISNSWIDLAFLGIVLFLVLLLGLKKVSRKKCFLLITLGCTILFAIILYQYFESLSKLMDNLIDHLFTSIYFPSTYAYLFILIIIDIVTIINLLHPKREKVYKTIHGIFFLITNFVLTLILEMIAKNEIDVFSKESLFSNTKLITLLEFSMNLFILWLVILTIAYFVNIITERIIIAKENKVLENDPVNIQSAVSVQENIETELKNTQPTNAPILEPALATAFVPDTTQNHFLPTFTNSFDHAILEIKNTDHEVTSYEALPKDIIPSSINYGQMISNTNQNENYSLHIKQEYPNDHQQDDKNLGNTGFDLSSFIPKKKDIRPIQSLDTSNSTNPVFEQILKNELPVIGPEPLSSSVSKIDISIEQEKSTYTLNDYRIFNKMLKDIREHNQSNSIRIDKNLEYRLITKYSTETYNMFKKMLKIYSN